MTEEQMNKWFPVKHVWPEVTDGQCWSGSCADKMRTVRISPSLKHPGFFDYMLTDIVSGKVEGTRRPCAAHALRTFLESEGIDPAAYQWSSAEVPA